MEPRYYQAEAVSSYFNYFANGGKGNPVVALPTGTGKSVVCGLFIQKAKTLYPHTRIMMLTHVKELIEQNYDKLMQIWPQAPAGIYSAGLRKRDTRHPITYAGIGSVAKRAAEFGHVDLVIIDECHLVSQKGTTQYRKFLDQLKEVNPNLKVLGLTATPYRLGQGMLIDDGLFTDVCYDATSMDSFNRLIDEGFLAPLIPKQTTIQLDVSDVKTRGGEFVAKDLQHAVDQAEVTWQALQEVRHHGVDRKHWLIFATGIEHAEHIKDMLVDMDISAVCVHSKMPSKQRDKNIADFLSGKVQALVNNGVLTTGFDFPALDMIVMLRPTSSPGLWVQMLGRGTRPFPGKVNCLVLDFAGNTMRLGPINDPVLPKVKGSNGKGSAPVRVCELCSTINHASARFCIECGEEFPRMVKIKTLADTGVLIATKNLPIVETFKVTGVQYTRHKSRNENPDSMKVTYMCGIRFFSEWVALENPRQRKRALDWWRLRDAMGNEPVTIKEALELADTLKQPDTANVWTNRKPYPQIKMFTFPIATASELADDPF